MIVLPNKRGILTYLQGLGWSLRIRNGVLIAASSPAGVADDVTFAALCNAYDELAAVKADKIAAIKMDGLTRIQQTFPAILDFEELRLASNIVQSIAPAARQLTAPMQRAAAVWQAGQDAITAVNSAATVAAVEAVTPVWPI